MSGHTFDNWKFTLVLTILYLLVLLLRVGKGVKTISINQKIQKTDNYAKRTFIRDDDPTICLYVR